jgi:secretion/DNA translocation related CpaE-like protein
VVTTTAGLLALIAETAMRDEVDRVAAAAGVRAIHLDPAAAPARKVWSAARAVVLDADSARRCADAGLPRRRALFLCVLGEPDAAAWQAAISVGAHRVLALPNQADELVRGLSDVDDTVARAARGALAAVFAGRGGAGASVFAAALAHQLSTPLLVDLDPWGGGIDLLLGAEHATGLRWPELAVQGGRLTWAAVREALPEHRGIAVLSGAKTSHELPAGAVRAVLEASRRAGVPTVCDLPRRLTEAACVALDDADLVVLLTSCDVRSCAATAAVAPVLTSINPNVGLVVRGPSPGGLRAAEIADLTRLPLLAAMRPEPMIAEKLERGGLRLRVRSPLAIAARRVAVVLGDHAADPSAAERAA